MSKELYEKISGIYDEARITTFTIRLGKSILEFLNDRDEIDEFKTNLDLGCGTGTLSKFFLDNGIESKGVDISPDMIEIARKNYPEIEFIVNDASVYEDYGKYDLVTCTHDAFNHITDIDKIKSTISNVNRWLRMDGYFVFDLNNFDTVPYDEDFIYDIDENSKLVYYPTRKDNLVNFNIRYFKDDEMIWNEDVTEYDHSFDELFKILNDKGFILETCSQKFYYEDNMGKWKIVVRKIEEI